MRESEGETYVISRADDAKPERFVLGNDTHQAQLLVQRVVRFPRHLQCSKYPPQFWCELPQEANWEQEFFV